MVTLLNNKMVNKSFIALNFFPLETQQFNFTIYRREAIHGQENPTSTHHRRLPVSNNYKNYKDAPKNNYWVSYEPKADYEKFDCSERTDFDLTEHYLYHLLKISSQSLKADEFALPSLEDEIVRFFRIKYVLAKHPGNRREIVWLEPYYLWSKNEFGFLVDFSLEIPREEKFNKKDLELSLTHKAGRRNFDFYADRFDKISLFVNQFHKTVFPLKNRSSLIYVKKKLRELEASSLQKKTTA